MFTKYQDFINENNKADGITTEEIELLKKYNIKNYRFNEETKMIDVDGDIDFRHKKLVNLPEIRLGVINGCFNCSVNQLTSLLYCPTSVIGNFDCYSNKLTSLEFCPTSVIGSFYCYYNQLTSLKYCPTTVNGNFSCSYNQLTSLLYCPISVTGDFNCYSNQLTSLEYCPTSVASGFYCSGNQLTSIEDYPLSLINGEISSDIKSFDIIHDLVKSKPDVYRPLIESKNKIRFHQQIMRDDPTMIQYYEGTGIQLLSKKTII